MAVSLKTITIFDSIAALTPAGVVIKDLDEIPQAVDPRQPTLYPLPGSAVSDFSVVRRSQGSAGGALMDVTYRMNYRFCCFPLASGRGLFDIYKGFLTRVVAIINALVAADTVSGLIDIEEWGWSFGIVTDPADIAFYGCDISIKVLEFQGG